jgi:hypothetical protein
VRKADQFGCACSATRVLPPDSPISEDCLFLNIWTGAASASEKWPVFVWFHGGRFIFGSGAQPLFDGEGLACKGLVVVTVNCRLGVFGFLATPELSNESGHNASGRGYYARKKQSVEKADYAFHIPIERKMKRIAHVAQPGDLGPLASFHHLVGRAPAVQQTGPLPKAWLHLAAPRHGT